MKYLFEKRFLRETIKLIFIFNHLKIDLYAPMFVQRIVFLEFSQMKQLQIFGISVLGVFVLLFGQQAFAADADRIAKCDQLAAHPDDSYRTEVVPLCWTVWQRG